MQEPRPQTVHSVILEQEIPGLHGLLHHDGDQPVGGDKLRQGQGKLLHNADLHEKFQQFAIPLHHDVFLQVAGKGVVNLLVHLWPWGQALRHPQGCVAHDIAVSLGGVCQILQTLLRIAEAQAVQISLYLFLPQAHIFLADNDKSYIDILGHEPGGHRAAVN